jgi:NADPH-dependent glutamate synthase beta subunit-like oxidoreductase
MLYCAIPEYRLPRDVIAREIDALIDDNIEIVCNSALGTDFTVDGLLEDGYGAVLLAIGAHQSRPLGLDNEDAPGVVPSIRFLKAFNQRGEQLARGRVGVIGGGNSALDAARTARRQRDVDSVVVIYRRTRKEMPAFDEEIEAALEEGITIETLVSPTAIRTTDGRLSHLECVRNRLGEPDASGRRRPVPIEGTEHLLELDTLIVAISEDSGVDCITPAREGGIEITDRNTVAADPVSLATSRPGVFAAGDLVTGPNTIVEAVAAGKRAAAMIVRHIRGQELIASARTLTPLEFVPPPGDATDPARGGRIETPRASVDWRTRNFAEVEVTLSVDEARAEAARCLRCDLEFVDEEAETPQAVGGHEP